MGAQTRAHPSINNDNRKHGPGATKRLRAGKTQASGQSRLASATSTSRGPSARKCAQTIERPASQSRPATLVSWWGNAGPQFGHVGPCCASLGPNSVKVWPTSAEAGHAQENVGPNWPSLAKGCHNLVQIVRIAAEPGLPEQFSSNLGATVGQLGSRQVRWGELPTCAEQQLSDESIPLPASTSPG